MVFSSDVKKETEAIKKVPMIIGGHTRILQLTNTSLSYFSSEEESEPHGAADLSGIEAKPHDDREIVIQPTDWKFKFKSTEERDEWVTAIKDAKLALSSSKGGQKGTEKESAKPNTAEPGQHVKKESEVKKNASILLGSHKRLLQLTPYSLDYYHDHDDEVRRGHLAINEVDARPEGDDKIEIDSEGWTFTFDSKEERDAWLADIDKTKVEFTESSKSKGGVPDPKNKVRQTAEVKKQGKFFFGRSDRFLRLMPYSLDYFKDEDSDERRGSVMLKEIKVHPVEEREMLIEPEGWKFQFDSRRERDEWVSSIVKAKQQLPAVPGESDHGRGEQQQKLQPGDKAQGKKEKAAYPSISSDKAPGQTAEAN